jgi:hypothetical protein
LDGVGAEWAIGERIRNSKMLTASFRVQDQNHQRMRWRLGPPRLITCRSALGQHRVHYPQRDSSWSSGGFRVMGRIGYG